MHTTFRINGVLTIHANRKDRAMLKKRVKANEHPADIDRDILQAVIDDTELEHIRPEDIGALTSAPILGILNADGEPIAAWGFMDYALRMIHEDLIETGKCVFVS